MRWQKAWSLDSWELIFFHKDLSKQQAFALTNVDLQSHQAVITFGTEVPVEVDYSRAGMSRTAKHEMVHVLLGKLMELAQYRFAMQREFDEAGHELVVKLMALL